MIKCLLPLACAGILLCANQHSARAGECPYPAQYVAALEEGPTSPSFPYAISCLAADLHTTHGHWAGPAAAADFRNRRADPYIPRIVKAVAKLLRSPWGAETEHRRQLCDILAQRGIAQLDSLDVFAVITSPPSFGHSLYRELAVLQECRAVDLLRTRYAQLRADPGSGYPEETLDLLSCLYHIPCDAALQAAGQFLAQEQDQELRARIQRVLDR